MDVALLKKMNIYPTEAASAGLIPDRTTGASTLVKADISLFHDMPLSAVSGPRESTRSAAAEEASTKAQSPSSPSDYDTGLKDGKMQSDAIYEDTIAILQKSVDALQRELGQMANAIEQSHMGALSDCIRALMPSLSQTATDLELQAVIKQACSPASEGTIHVRVHPDKHAHTQRLCQPHGRKISITADASLMPDDVAVEWLSGGAEINCQAAADAFLELLGNAQTGAKPPIPTEMIDG